MTTKKKLMAILLFIVSITLTMSPTRLMASPPHPSKLGRAPHDDVYKESPFKKPWNRSFAPIAATGSKEVLVLRCEFQPDTDPETTGDGIMTKDKAYFDDIGTKFNKYFMDNSYGSFDPKVTVSDKVYRLANTMTHYGQGTESSSKMIAMFHETVDLADADIDFSKYDAFVIAHAGYGQEADIARQGQGDTPNDIWSVYIGTTAKPVDSITITSFTVIPEREDQDNNPENSVLGIFAHEFGHQMGLPDLYDIDNSSSGIGDWGLMSHGAWLDDGNTPSMLCAWSRKYLGYITPTPVNLPSSTITLGLAHESKDMLMVYVKDDGTTDQYFLIENRAKQLWDAHQAGEGVLIWHIDDSVGSVTANNVNANDFRRRVDLECANGIDSTGKDDLDYNDSTHKTSSQDHCYYLSGKNYFNSSTNPSSLAYGELNGNVSLRVTSEPGQAMQMILNKTTGVITTETKITDAYTYPNPVRSGACRFRYNLHFIPSEVEIKIYNNGGKLVNKFDASTKFGENDFVFFPLKFDGSFLNNGVYFYKINAIIKK